MSSDPHPSAPPPQVMMPHMSGGERDMFARNLEGVRHYLEFGAGGSTAFAARAGVASIASVESDAAWLDRLRHLPEMAGVAFIPHGVDIGPTGDWGVPKDPAAAPKWPNYYRTIWRKLPWTPDLVLVDGRFRVACAMSCLLHCPAGTPVLIHDFLDRPQYHVVLDHFDTVEKIDTLIVLRVPESPDLRAVMQVLLNHVTDFG